MTGVQTCALPISGAGAAGAAAVGGIVGEEAGAGAAGPGAVGRIAGEEAGGGAAVADAVRGRCGVEPVAGGAASQAVFCGIGVQSYVGLAHTSAGQCIDRPDTVAFGAAAEAVGGANASVQATACRACLATGDRKSVV